MPTRRSPRARFVALATVLAACRGGSEPTNPPLFEVLSGAGQADTIFTQLPVLVVIQARQENGDPAAPGATVSVGDFYVQPPYIQTENADDPTDHGGYYLTAVNAQGQLRLRVWLGSRAGVQSIAMAYPGNSHRDTLRVNQTVLPGHAIGVDVQPAVATVAVGATTQLDAHAVDMGFNFRTDAVGYTSLAPGVATVSASGLVSGAAMGTAKIVATSGAFTDTTTITVQ